MVRSEKEDENMIAISLVRKFKCGDEQAFYELVNRYKGAISSIVYRYIKDKHETEDVTQEIFLHLYKCLRSYKEKSKFFTWLYRVVVNTCMYYKRRVKSVISSDVIPAYLEIPDIESNPVHLLEKEDITENVNKAIDSLSDELKMVLILRELENFSYEEIADILKISIGTVKSRLHNARVIIGQKLTMN